MAVALGEPRKLWIEGPAGKLEAMLRLAAAPRALAVVAHPLPTHGGTMHNPVVFRSERELGRIGFSTLRFNFRGTQGSDGSFDNGVGEIDDLAAAVSWLRGVAPARAIFLVGFSFGSLCSLRLAEREPEVAAVIGIGVPVRKYDLRSMRPPVPVVVVQAEADELGSPAEIRAWLEQARPDGRLVVVPGTTHLFPGRAQDAAACVAEAAERLLGERG